MKSKITLSLIKRYVIHIARWHIYKPIKRACKPLRSIYFVYFKYRNMKVKFVTQEELFSDILANERGGNIDYGGWYRERPQTYTNKDNTVIYIVNDRA